MSARQAVNDMAAIKLTNRKHIQRRNQQADPTGKSGLGEEVETAFDRTADQDRNQEPDQKRFAVEREGHSGQTGQIRCQKRF